MSPTATDDLNALKAAVTASQKEAADADDLVNALEERVRNGDVTVDAKQIGAQRELAGFAKLRAEAARRTATRAETARKLSAVAAVKATFDTLNGGTASNLAALNTAFATMEIEVAAAVRKYRGEVAKRDAKIAAVIGQAREAGISDWHVSDGTPEPSTYIARGVFQPTLFMGGVQIEGGHPLAEGGRLLRAVNDAADKAVRS